MMNKANFVVDTGKCIGCESCVKVCAGGILSLNQSKKAEIAEFKEFGWNGCWASRGLGAVMLTFALGALEQMPDIKAMLKIPEHHYVGMSIGFGYPEINYARGVQKQMKPGRIHRLHF